MSCAREYVDAIGREMVFIVASSHDGIVGMTASGVVSSFNPAAARSYGYIPVRILVSQRKIEPSELREGKPLSCARSSLVGRSRPTARSGSARTARW